MDVNLRLYFEQIDSLIDGKQVDEAVAHCRHILSYYPKSIEAYRLLGKSLLDKGRHGDAADIFQRVLSAVPDDFISHVGMAIVREDEANIAAACWHMERAFEVNPSNSAIQEELRRLYGRRDGITPPKTRLTRGALARLYTQGELFVQAEAEIKAALADDPERTDLTTLLAHVYWRNDQRAQAAEACSAVLQKLPYSLEANRILADIFNLQGRPQDAAAYKQRLEALDPYEAFAAPGANGQGAAEAKPEAVRIPRLDYLPGMDESGQPDWVASLGQSMDSEPAPTPSPTADWMSNPFGSNSPFAADLPSTSDLPDWLEPGQPAAPAESVPDLSAAPDWLSGSGSAPAEPNIPAAAADMPDWMKGMAPPGTGPLAAASPAAAPDWMQDMAGDSGAALAADMPDWMKDASAGDAVSKILTGPVTPEPAPADDTPDWMKGALFGGAVSSAVVGAMETPAETPGWLKGVAEPGTPASDAPPAPVPGTGPLNTNVTPDWMKDVKPLPGTSPLGSGSKAVRRMTDWLKPPPGFVEPEPAAPPAPSATEAPASAPGSPAAAEPAPDLPDWMKASDEQPPSVLSAESETPAWMKAAAAQQTNVLTGSDEPPAWMRAAEAQQTNVLPGRDLPPGWSKAAEAQQTNVLSGSEAVPSWMQSEASSASAQPEAEIPAWMSGAAPSAEPAGASEVPDWMRSAAQTPADIPGAAAEPADWMKEATEPMAPGLAPDWMQGAVEAEPTAADPAGEIPDWMRAAEPSAPSAEPSAVTDVPDWLKSAAQTPADAAGAEPAAEIPSWMSAADLSATSAQPTPVSDIPDWMRGVEPEASALVAQAAAEIPSWMSAADVSATSAEPTPASEIPDWMRGVEPEGSASTAEPAAEIPSWMSAADSATSVEPPMAPSPAGFVPDAGDKPDWLKQMEAEADAYDASVAPPVPAGAKAPTEEKRPATLADLPDFLQPASADAIAAANTPPTEEELEAENWLANAVTTAQDVEVAEAVPASDIPDWLKAMAPPPADVAPAAAAPAAPEKDLSEMSPDEALKWLEGLALAQGGKPEEMVSLAGEASSRAAPPTPEGVRGDAVTPPTPEAQPPADWLRTPAEEDTPPAEMPEWVHDAEPSPTDTVTHWLADKNKSVPEWLRQPGEEAASPPADWLRTPIEDEAKSVSAEPEIAVAPEAELPFKAPATLPTAPGEMPDWLAETAAALPTEPEAYEPKPAAPAPAPGVPTDKDLSEMSADEALKWLETLALQQGGNPEEMVSGMQPGEASGRAEPPAYEDVHRGVESLPTEPTPAAATPAGEMPDWLQETAAALPTEPEAYEPKPAAPKPEPGAPTDKDLSEMSADEALKWLETLALQQGGNPEEMVSLAGEASGRAEPPAYEDVHRGVESLPAAAEPVATTPAEELPAWLAKAAPAEAAPAEEVSGWIRPPAEQPASPPSRPEPAPAPKPAPESKPAAAADAGESEKLSRLAEKLSAARRAKDEEIARRFEEERAEREAARRAVQEKMETKRRPSGTGPLGTGNLGTGKLATGQLGTGRFVDTGALTQPVPAARPAAPKPEPKPKSPPRPKAPVRPRGKAAKSAYAKQPADETLAQARQRLGDGDLEGSAEAFDYLVSTSQQLDALIADLEAYTAAHRGAAPLLQVLGDAYMKNNRLQIALDTYRRALDDL